TYTDPADSSRLLLSSGLGFAIPINLAKHIIPLLIEQKNISRGFLGVRITDVIQFNEEKGYGKVMQGANVTAVFEGSPAEKAGIQPGDIILELNGEKVQSANQLKNQVGWIAAGTEVLITIERKEDEEIARKNIKIMLSERPTDVN
ncbi:MAG: PDZ domain-containing protein, partial [Nanoarchaeota archaeon]